MTLLRRPRPIYRVYAEEEFFAAEDWREEPEPVRLDPATPAGPRGRLAGVAALGVAFAALVSILALDAMRSDIHSSRGTALARAVRGRPPGHRASKGLPLAPTVLPSASPVRDVRRRARAPHAPIAPRSFAQTGAAPDAASTPAPAGATAPAPASSTVPASATDAASTTTPADAPEFGFER
jgi:hypothetical protein